MSEYKPSFVLASADRGEFEGKDIEAILEKHKGIVAINVRSISIYSRVQLLLRTINSAMDRADSGPPSQANEPEMLYRAVYLLDDSKYKEFDHYEPYKTEVEAYQAFMNYLEKNLIRGRVPNAREKVIGPVGERRLIEGKPLFD